MASILDEIIAYKRQYVEERRKQVPLEMVHQLDESAPMPPSFFEALIAEEEVAVIAEIKKASPSKGVIRADFDPVMIGEAYEENGATAISVLTDQKYFQGTDEYLTQVSNVVDIPILRKDFVIDPYQIYEARAIGAAAVLLIVAALQPEELEGLLQVCKEVELDALVEVHTYGEVMVALEAGADIVGINNRDLTTFQTDLQTTFDLMDYLPDDLVIVSESGIHTRDDVVRLSDAGVDAVLVGESLMRAPDIGLKLRELLGRSQ
ncbi:MAG: indole-3-glycerol phosphate synthase TrpC [bacterium]|nr:indole-3-glycerol phosphate synthase TrpC [bacterium]